MKLSLLVLVPMFFLAQPQGQAEVRLPKVLASHMVVQRGVGIHVWGLATPGEKVSVSLEGDSSASTADTLGRWSVTLPARPAGGPFKLVVKGKSTIELSDVLVGDVWVASGQSNMEMPVSGFANAPVKDSAAEIAKAQYPNIRLLLVKKAHSQYPLDDIKGDADWQACTPETVKNFSAVGYFFARDIQLQEKVPIGIIDSTWGGTPGEAWMSMDGLARMPSLSHVIAERAADMDNEESFLLQLAADKQLAAEGKKAPKRDADMLDPWEPGALYNGMIAPLTKLPIRGVIWYQGESNAGENRAYDYEDVFSHLIEDWRAKWNIGDFPFLYVQIAPSGSNPKDGRAVVRDAQRRVLRVKNTGMAVTVDVGELNQVHPAQKQVVGARLALLAMSVAYGENVVSSGPLFREAVPQGGAIRVKFDFADGLKSVNGPPGEFEVAGEDGVFAKANAKIDGDTIIASSSEVPHPVFVRYAWKSFPAQANLYNQANLPASPFTSKPPSARQ